MSFHKPLQLIYAAFVHSQCQIYFLVYTPTTMLLSMLADA